MSEEEADRAVQAHFDQRAARYDEWWLGTGSFADRDRPGWPEEVEQLVGVIAALPPSRVLDVACGTGFLTQHLRGDVVALDRSGPMTELAAARMPNARVIQGAAVPLPFDDGEFERVFTSHFLHHLRPDERAAFVAEARRVGDELVVVEGVRMPEAPQEEWLETVASDGAAHSHYKRSFTADELAEELGDASVLHEGRWFTVVAS